MKKFLILTIFPDIFDSYISKSIPRISQEKKLVEIKPINIREFPEQQVDDYVFGGGPGMVLKIDPIVNAIRKHDLTNDHIILLTPRGEQFSQKKAKKLAEMKKNIVLICGHYEGVDERIKNYISEEISIGDYVLSSGELPAMVLIDAVIRLVPGVINQESLKNESFEDFLLDFPVYTRPRVFENFEVPEVLLSGDHKKIEKFRYEQRISDTKKIKPELYDLFLKNKK